MKLFPTIALATIIGCSSSPYVCTSNAQCIDGSGNTGICETSGYCSFEDATCTDTGQRFDSSAGGNNASQCVAKSAMACVAQISVGIQFSCYLRTDGTVWCWGNNTDGEIGDGTSTDRLVPTKVGGLPDASSLPAIEVTTAEEHACALLKDGEVWCWGINDTLNLGQCNGANLTNSLTPVRIPKWSAGTGGSGSGSATGPVNPVCSASMYFAAQVPTATYVNTLTAGGEHTCAVGTDDNLYCWGENTTGNEGGQAGQDFNALPNVPGPLQVTGTSGFTGHVVDVQAGDDFTCLLKDDNSAWCWGGNQLGELANNGTTQSDAPVAISGFGDVAQLLVDDETGCVLTRADGVVCWGNGTTGIFGLANDPTNNEMAATNLTTATNLFGGPTAESLCLNTADGALRCWGDNGTGEAGIGALAPLNITAPTNAQLSSVTQLRIGQYHTCALTRDGSLWCWGDNSHGELGNGSMSTTPSPTPARVNVVCP
jgi:alpha-tubulin suppressor-like RCC1 family protein